MLEFLFRGLVIQFDYLLSLVVSNALLIHYTRLDQSKFLQCFRLDPKFPPKKSSPPSFIGFKRALIKIFFIFIAYINYTPCCLVQITFLLSSPIMSFEPLTYHSQCKLLRSFYYHTSSYLMPLLVCLCPIFQSSIHFQIYLYPHVRSSHHDNMDADLIKWRCVQGTINSGWLWKVGILRRFEP